MAACIRRGSFSIAKTPRLLNHEEDNRQNACLAACQAYSSDSSRLWIVRERLRLHRSGPRLLQLPSLRPRPPGAGPYEVGARMFGRCESAVGTKGENAPSTTVI